VPDAVVEILEFALEAGLTPSAFYVVLLALGVDMDVEHPLRELAATVLAGQLGVVAVLQVATDFLADKFLVAVHALNFSELALFPQMLVDHS